MMTAKYTPFFRAKSSIQRELLPEGIAEEIWENGIRYELSSSFPANTPSGWGPDGLLSKSEIEKFFQPITLGGKTFYNVIERNGYRYFAAFPSLYHYKQDNIIEGISIERIEDTADRIVINVTATGLGVSVTYPVTYSVVKTGSLNTPKPFAIEWTSSSFALLDAYLTQNGLSPFDVSPETGDNTVFLLPAAALALGGILLAAKKRKRDN
ncbi:MAG: LPXTG cell wall anchor domain-containing protein [Clostridia bacterium]|nr:LPXTG cell wall anchor domain-containing protein [Clostridia bacterium]